MAQRGEGSVDQGFGLGCVSLSGSSDQMNRRADKMMVTRVVIVVAGIWLDWTAAERLLATSFEVIIYCFVSPP